MDLALKLSSQDQFAVSSQTLMILAATLVIGALLYLSSFGKKLREHIGNLVLLNWRLALLGATGIVLSLASGWTTWDGMRNFTKEPVLSLMITFGIQGVMLIVAWLIGESFSAGMNYRPQRQRGNGTARSALGFLQPMVGSVIGVLMFLAIAALILNHLTAGQAPEQAAGGWLAISDNLLFASIAILIVAGILLLSFGEIARDYTQAVRVVLRSAVLWVMFLACMATSVFFSFDSLFSTIFPARERERAAVLRAQNQVAGVVNDIGTLASKRRIEEQDALFQRPAWQRYEATLDQLVTAARQAPDELEAYFERKMRERQNVVAQRQEEKASAEGQQARLTQRKNVLVTEISRAKEQIAPLSSEVERLKSEVFAKDREVIAKKAEAEAEAGGIGATSKVGRGPKYREIATELYRLQEQKKNLQLQLREFEKRLDTARNQLTRNESELSTIDGQLAQLAGRAQTAEQLIQMAQQARTRDEPQFDPTNGLRQLERARINFRQNPTKEGLTRLQSLCTTLVGAMSGVPTLKDKARAIDCDPGDASEAAARVFALNVGVTSLAKNCVGGGKLPETGGADALFRFARSCVQDAGLPSADTDKLRRQINSLELNRDDKAHRFVVTSNAFADGNKLAYLALAIAIAIDTLVFMSGLFGANAVRSPLSDVPGPKGRSAQQLEAVIDVALGPHAYDTARHVLGAMHPITPENGFTAELVISDNDPHGSDIRRVLNAGASIGAVQRPDAETRRYLVRSELFEYLSMVAKREFEKDKSHGNLAQLDRTITVALLPDVGANAELVLSHLHPIQEHNGFMAEIRLKEIDSAQLKPVRSTLNAGAIYERVQRVGDDPNHYYIHSDFFKTLLSIRGRLLVSGAMAPAIAHEPTTTGVVEGGTLKAQSGELSTGHATRQLTGPDQPASGHDSEGSQQSDEDASDPMFIDGQPLSELRDIYLDRLASAMGIGADVVNARLSSDGVLAASNSAWSALSKQGEANPRLKRLIREYAQSLEDRLGEEYTMLRSAIGGKSSQLQLLDEIDENIKVHFYILLMFPESGLLDHLIAELEAAASQDGELVPGDQTLKDGLVNVRDAFLRSDLTVAEDWQYLAQAINDLPGGTNIYRLDGGNDKSRRSNR